jgi:hypothetical protein
MKMAVIHFTNKGQPPISICKGVYIYIMFLNSIECDYTFNRRLSRQSLRLIELNEHYMMIILTKG